MTEEYPRSELPVEGEKRPEEREKGTQIANIIEAWDEAHKIKKEFISDELWQELRKEVGTLSFFRQLDSSGESAEVKEQTVKLAALGRKLREAEQRHEAVKEGKKFLPLIARALKYDVPENSWLNFWDAFFGKGMNETGFQDLGRFIDLKFAPPVKELNDNRFLYKVPSSDIYFIVKFDSQHKGKVVIIVMARDKGGIVERSVT